MKKNNLLITCFFIFLVGTSYGQRREWNLGVFADPSDRYRVKINGEIQDPGFAFNVEPGRIELEIWSPHHKTFDTAFVYHSGKMVIRKELEQTDELKQYYSALKEQSKIQSKAYLSFGGAALCAAGAAINYGALGNRRYRYRLQELGNEYDLVGYNQESYDDARTSLIRSRVMQYTMYAGFAGLTYYGIKKIIQMNEVDVPELKEDRSFYVDEMGLSPSPMGGVHGMIRIKF